MDLVIRPAVPDDSPCIIDLLSALAAFEGSPGAVTLTEERLAADAFGAAARFEILVAEWRGRVVGLATLLAAYSSWRAAPTLILHDLYVEPAVRGAGIGARLLGAVARTAVDRGCCRIDVNVVRNNSAGQSFYRRAGFVLLADWLPHRLDGEALTRLAGRA